MMTDAETIASQFHEVYESLAERFGYKTREESAVPWKDVPMANKRLMMSTVTVLINRRVIEVGKGLGGSRD